MSIGSAAFDLRERSGQSVLYCAGVGRGQPGSQRKRLFTRAAAAGALVSVAVACTPDGRDTGPEAAVAPTAAPAAACPLPDPTSAAAVTAFLGLWDRAEIVVLGERHGFVAEHEFLGQLVCDPRFAETVDTVAVEFAGAARQSVLDEFIAGGDIEPAQLASVWRDSTQRSGVWDQPIYRTFFERVRAVNERLLDGERPVRVLAGDPPIDWSAITATTECDERSPTCLDHWLQQRDRHFADVVAEEAAGAHVLVIAGVGHVKGSREVAPADGRPPTLTALLEADRPGEVALVLPSGTGQVTDAVVGERLGFGPAPSLVDITGSWLARTSPCALGLDFADACAAASTSLATTIGSLADAFLQLPGPAPDGASFAYSAEIDGNQDIYLSRPGELPLRLTSSPDDEFDPDISPDGTRIAYRRNPEPGSDAADIWVMELDGAHQRNLTNAPELSNWAPAWTPDGRITFSSTRGGGGLELWVMDADGGEPARVAPGWCEYASPSPDGDRFVCASSAAGGTYDLAIVGRDGSRMPLTTTPETEFGAAWSPDGEWIAFARDLGERWELRRIRPDGTDESRVFGEGVFPTWTPAGLLVWTGPGGLNVATAAGEDRQVVDQPADFVSFSA